MDPDIRDVVKEKYGQAALRVLGGGSSCCGATVGCGTDDQGIDVDAIASEVDGKFMSAFIRATKPKSCCDPGCCSSKIS